MFGAKQGSTAHLMELCFGYFIFYVITGVSVKYFLYYPQGPELEGMEYLVYSTAGGTLFATGISLVLRWYRLDSVRKVEILGFKIPFELLYIIPSGAMTAVVVPTTTLMYSFRTISVMVAMVLMRGAVIIIGRVVDAVLIKQKILKKTVYKEENIAVVFALMAVGTKLFSGGAEGKQSLFSSFPVMIIFTVYLIAYAFRIYIMNYYKNTRPPEAAKKNNNKAFFAIEQFSCAATLIIITVVVVMIIKANDISGPRATPFAEAVINPDPSWWYLGVMAGVAFGIVAIFSVFLFMFKGRTATFSGLVNRLTSLIAGTASTLIFAAVFGGKWPVPLDWLVFLFIVVAVAFMGMAEKKRTAESV